MTEPMKAATITVSGTESTPIARICCTVSGAYVPGSAKARPTSRRKKTRSPMSRKTPIAVRAIRRKNRIPVRAGIGNVSVGRPLGGVARSFHAEVLTGRRPRPAASRPMPPAPRAPPASRPHSRHEDVADDREDHVRDPPGEIRLHESLLADRLRQLDHHEEDDRRAERDADAVGGPPALRARRERRAEEGDDDAGDGDGD